MDDRETLLQNRQSRSSICRRSTHFAEYIHEVGVNLRNIVLPENKNPLGQTEETTLAVERFHDYETISNSGLIQTSCQRRVHCEGLDPGTSSSPITSLDMSNMQRALS